MSQGSRQKFARTFRKKLCKRNGFLAFRDFGCFFVGPLLFFCQGKILYPRPKCSKLRDLTAVAICDSNRESQITSNLSKKFIGHAETQTHLKLQNSMPRFNANCCPDTFSEILV